MSCLRVRVFVCMKVGVLGMWVVGFLLQYLNPTADASISWKETEDLKISDPPPHPAIFTTEHLIWQSDQNQS